MKDIIYLTSLIIIYFKAYQYLCFEEYKKFTYLTLIALVWLPIMSDWRAGREPELSDRQKTTMIGE